MGSLPLETHEIYAFDVRFCIKSFKKQKQNIAHYMQTYACLHLFSQIKIWSKMLVFQSFLGNATKGNKRWRCERLIWEIIHSFKSFEKQKQLIAHYCICQIMLVWFHFRREKNGGKCYLSITSVLVWQQKATNLSNFPLEQ